VDIHPRKGKMVFAVIAAWIAILYLSWRVERKTSTSRHVELFKQALREELHQIQLEKLATPGGSFTPRLAELADAPLSKSGA
jgi:hypothetical protein